MKKLLSIIIISHNQRNELIRCVDSVLAQDIPFEYEIILSDDRSTDGTFEVAQEYASKYPFIIATQCNSDECNPVNNSQRSGWNRCNGYKKASGKYITHIDGDDFYKGSDCLRLQVELLENNPTCSLCMQNIWCWEEGKDILEGERWHKFSIKTGQFFSANDFFINKLFILNQAFVMRKNPDFDPVLLYDKFYVDSIITFHHLQYGDIIYLDKCDYVYVQSPNSIIHSYENQYERDIILTLSLTVIASYFIPKFTGLYYYRYKEDLLRVINLILKGKRVINRSESLKFFDIKICKLCLQENLSILNIIRLQLIRTTLIFISKFDIKNKLVYKFLHLLFYGKKIDKRCIFQIK